MKIEEYFEKLEIDVKKVYEFANKARAKNLDPVTKVEIPLAKTMAEKCVELIATIYPQMSGCGIDERILELEKKYGKLASTVVFKISEEVAKQKFCKFESVLQGIDAGIRIGFAYQTLGVVSSPIEGYTGLQLGKTRDGKEYFIVSFSGPIRSAGTTASSIILILIDYLREMFGYSKYDPSEDEIKRYVTECYDYHERVTNLQYIGTEEELAFLAKNLPIQIAGDPTEKLEVSNYKNLERVSTNYIRGGVCLAFSEGLAQKAAKAWRLLNNAKKNGIKCTGFDFIEEYLELHEKRDKGNTDDSPVYIKDLVAGRPVFGHPSESGAFRFRYGRGRNSGFSAASLHPATMAVVDNFIAIGTQLKIEKPTKGCAITSCDSIDGPIVKLVNGNVRKLNSMNEAKRIFADIEEIIYLGDILFPFSDVANRNAQLIKPGYVEEWWKLDLLRKNPDLKNIDSYNVDFEKAVEFSEKYGVPLHPKYIYYWTQINYKYFSALINWLNHSRINGKLIMPFNKSEEDIFHDGKRALELLGVEHSVTVENVVLDETNTKSFLVNLGLETNLGCRLLKDSIFLRDISQEKEVLEIVNSLSKFTIKDKAGEFIGSRMGRPEKSKLRKLTGSPNVLFPVGKEGGRLRSINFACEGGKIKSFFPLFYCEKCEEESIYPCCEICGSPTKKMYYCPQCKEKSFKKCEEHEISFSYSTKDFDIKNHFDRCVKNLGLETSEVPALIKGVRGTSSEGRTLEHLSKGILRAKHGLQVNKDGTIRFDCTELPLVSFKPKEIFVSIDKLKDLGYSTDIYGKELKDEDQIIELMPHDVLIPIYPNLFGEKGDEVFINITKFIDELLVKFYKLEPFYNLKNKEDLVGQMGVCMAPHNCAGVICRFIGFSNTLGLMASPYLHAAIRRDCDGDEAAIMLLGDVLLNFSKKFLPSHRGGTQDAPLVLNSKINAGEVDDQILDFEFSNGYPLELYEAAEKMKHSSEVKIETVETIMKQGKDPFSNLGFTHETNNFNEGVQCSNYKLLATMQEKVKHQMELVEKIRAVNTSDTARLILERHFIRDMKGNLRKFSMQDFRCVACNEILRRPPLKGICPKCGGKIIFTIHEGGLKKYLEPALDLAKRYNLSTYIQQNLELTKRYIESIFGKELEEQKNLKEWFG